MCGIVYIKRKDKRPAYKSVLKRYRHQQTRGQQGFGYVAIQDNKIVSYKRSDNERDIIDMLTKETAEEILFHHRRPTSTPNIEESAHPLLIENEKLSHQYFIAHNGVIRNDDELKEQHEKLGFDYMTEIMRGFTSLQTGKHYSLPDTAFNDSEALAVETALALDGKKKDIGTEGAAAVVGIKSKGQMVTDRFFFRNIINPLHFNEDNVMITITSLGKGKELETTNVFRLKEGGGFEPYRPIVLSPLSYKPTKAWYEKDKEENKSQLMLPRPPMGYHRSADLEHYGGSEFDFSEPPIARTARARSTEEIIKEIDALVAGRGVVSRMTDNTLWEEFDKALGIQDTLKEEMDMLDNMAEDDMYGMGEIFERRRKLQDRHDSTTEYLGRLEAEITKREAGPPMVLPAETEKPLSAMAKAIEGILKG